MGVGSNRAYKVALLLLQRNTKTKRNYVGGPCQNAENFWKSAIDGCEGGRKQNSMGSPLTEKGNKEGSRFSAKISYSWG